MKKKNHYLRANYFAPMLATTPFIEKSFSTILPGGPRYTYVLNNPLKYTDPSGYVYHRLDLNEDWNESWQAYGEMMSAINGAYDKGYNRSKGGGGYYKPKYSDGEWIWTTVVQGGKEKKVWKFTGKTEYEWIPFHDYTSNSTDTDWMPNSNYEIDDRQGNETPPSIVLFISNSNSQTDDPKTEQKHKKKPLIPNPYGFDGHTSWENIRMSVEYIEMYGLDSHIFENDDPSNAAAQELLKFVSNELPTSAVVFGIYKATTGKDPTSTVQEDFPSLLIRIDGGIQAADAFIPGPGLKIVRFLILRPMLAH